MADIKKVLIENYMPYAKGVIIARAIPAIDGLKPVNRRILYTMYKMGLLKGNKTKSANIVGQTMRLHPHGDAAIYDALVRMTTGHEALNVPYVESKGSFGKIYSRDTEAAAPRYTEAKLAEICKELFDGIDEDAVDFVDNYDSTMKEPVVLPVKFPSILVNTSSGIAVGTSSSIPSFGLKSVCQATIGILKGEITTVSQLMEVLGAPEFPTGGHIHGNEELYEQLGRDGKCSLTISGTVQTYPDKIVITEIPYKATVEGILDEIREHVKSGELKEVVDVRDESDLNGLRAVVELKRGSDVRKALKKINKLTNLRMRISFTNRVILTRDGKSRCVELGVFDLLQEWIKFRMETVRRIYSYRLKKKQEQEHLLAAWEKIKDGLREVANYITNNEEEKVKAYLVSKYGLDEVQAEYLLDMKVREFTKDRLRSRLSELVSVRADIKVYSDVVSNDEQKKAIIISELEAISNKYGTDRKTIMVPPLEDEGEDKLFEEEIEDIPVTVIITKRGYIKRITSLRDMTNIVLHDDDAIRWRFTCSNRGDVLIFTYSGMCYKIPVHSIDASRGVPKDYIFNLIDREDDSEVLYAAYAGDYTGHINIVYASGRGTKVKFSRVAGNRSKYRSLFESGRPGTLWCTTADKFFIITKRKRAAYIDLELTNAFNTRTAFKVARIPNDDDIFGIQPLTNVPDKDTIDLEKYSKGYCVKIRDRLW